MLYYIVCAQQEKEHEMRVARLWRNWQTRTVEGRVRDRVGSNPTSRTKKRHRTVSFYYALL